MNNPDPRLPSGPAMLISSSVASVTTSAPRRVDKSRSPILTDMGFDLSGGPILEGGCTRALGSTAVNRLRAVTFLPSKLMYSVQGFPGAFEVPYLAEPTIELLAKASDRLARSGFELLLWDAFRTRTTQQYIFDLCKQHFAAARPKLTGRELHARTCAFVSDPAGVFPHGTGGAVDVTLVYRGCEANLGTGFDDFSDRSAADFFRQHPPTCAEDREAEFNRELLRGVMLDSGFVGIGSEWWHFEAFTTQWAISTNKAATLVHVLEPPAETDSVSMTASWASLQIFPRFVLDDSGSVVKAPT